LNFQINAIPLTGATGYRFEVTNGTTNEVNVIENNSASGFSMRLTSLPSGGYFGITYSIRVSVKSSLGVWGDYGSSCTVTSPAAPASTKVNTGQCGTTVATLNTPVFADIVIGANAYKFEVKQNGNVIAELTNASSFFNIGNIPGIAYGQTYSIRVAVRYNGTTWSNYANRTCDISTPSASPLTTIGSQCGTTIAAKDTVIYATPVLGVSSYKFEVSLGGTVLSEYTNNTSYFSD